MNQPKTFEEALDVVLAEMRATMIKKNGDYSSRNVDNIAEFGELGVLIRANDKMARLKNLLYHNKHEPANESVYDTWLDNANYSVIAMMIRRNVWGLPLDEGASAAISTEETAWTMPWKATMRAR